MGPGLLPDAPCTWVDYETYETSLTTEPTPHNSSEMGVGPADRQYASKRQLMSLSNIS